MLGLIGSAEVPLSRTTAFKVNFTPASPAGSTTRQRAKVRFSRNVSFERASMSLRAAMTDLYDINTSVYPRCAFTARPVSYATCTPIGAKNANDAASCRRRLRPVGAQPVKLLHHLHSFRSPPVVPSSFQRPNVWASETFLTSGLCRDLENV